ncbi:MAG: molecular chaperone DnaK [Myxococcota bacterium]
MARVIGIDLGTTNSCVAIVDGDQSKVLASRTGQRTIPSIVAVSESGKRLVGHLAKRQAITNPDNTIYGAKRLIGRRWQSTDVEKMVEHVPYRCEAGPHQDVRVRLADHLYAVPEISSMVLQEMRLIAEASLGEPIEQAVVTVPAYFNDSQRQATKDAGRIAGLDVLRIINEPTAAALAYGFGKGIEQRVAIYDLGGGTFDISLLEIGDGVFEVLATAGDTFLGGEDFDERIIDWLADGFKGEYGVELRTEKMALQRLRDAAEKAKMDLSSVTETDINLPFIYSPPDRQALHLQKRLARNQLNELVEDLIQRSLDICDKAFESAGLTPSDIEAVILVGGMTRMPRVQEAVQTHFGTAPSKGVHPDEVVALGASIQGFLLTSSESDTVLLDVTPHNLGIMVAGGVVDVIIERDTTIPTSAEKMFTTVRDNQTQVRIMVMQGDSPQAPENELLGEFVLDGLREAPRGVVKIEVSFNISADGIVSVSARDAETGREQVIEVTASSGLTEDEIRKMIAENRDTVASAEASEAFETEKVEVERTLREIERLLPEARPIIASTDFGAEALRKAEQSVADARAAIARHDAAELSATHGPLQRTMSLLKNVIEKLKQ